MHCSSVIVGRVIGRRGATAQSIRTLLRALGTKNDARYNLKIVNTDGERVGQISSDDPDDTDYEHTEPTEARTVADIDDEVEEPASDLAEKTRADLADLDDLDI